MGKSLTPALAVGLRSFVSLVSSDTVQKKLSGQVLNRITGGLQRAVLAGQGVVHRGDQVLVGWVGVSNLSYGVWHEEGFKGRILVEAHMRRRTRLASGRRRRGELIPVREHMKNVNVPAKHFVENTLREDSGEGSLRLSKCVFILARTGKLPRIGDLSRSAASIARGMEFTL